MVLGNEQTGKTSLLQAFKRESANSNQGQGNRRKSTSNRNFPILNISEYRSVLLHFVLGILVDR